MDAEQELLAVFRAEVEDQIDDLCERMSRDPKRWKIDRLFQISQRLVEPVTSAIWQDAWPLALAQNIPRHTHFAMGPRSQPKL